ncbi:MAG: PAS domain-containing protein, partial [Chroococcidiopsis sp.]
MQKWAEHAPMNYLHKFPLVEAEKARVLGQFFEAEEFYERAISGASENEFIQEEALAYELAAKHYLARGREKIAQTYMKEAHYCYDRWGAKAKVKELETRYPQFFSQSYRDAPTAIPITSETVSNTSLIAFDLTAVMKASQTISREIELEQLLRSLMQILIQNAGAQTGYLILENSGEWLVEASCELSDENNENTRVTQILQSVPIANRLPESIIQYVIRTQECVILNNAIGEGAFINEPYIQQNKAKSIFCLPLLNQAKLVGVLYLENQLAVGAFTTERTQVLNLLSTQAAIAIENAKLYSKLRAKESKIAQFLEAVPVGIAIVDATGRPYYANQRGIQLMGKGTDPTIAPEQISAVYQFYVAGTEQIYPTERLPNVRALRGDRTRIEDLEIRQNNTTIPVEAWGTPVYDERGNIAYAIATFQDISDRKQAEKLLADYNRTLEQQVAERTAALQKSEAKFRNIFENSQVGIFRTRLSDGLILDANQRLAHLFGFDSPEEVIGLLHGADCYVNPSDRQQAIELLKRHGELQNFEVQLRKRDGTLFWGLYSSRQNAADGCMEGVIADISDRVSAEAALRERERELRLIANALPALVGYVNANGRYQFVNRTYEDWFRCSRDEILGKSVRELLGETAYHIAKPYIERVQTGQNTTYEAEILYPVGKKYVSVTYIPDAGPNAQVKGYYVLVTDISDRKRAEEVLRQSEAQFREQAILSAFRADVDSALAQSDSLPLTLHRCAAAVVKHFNAAFARIWTLNQDKNVLELQASAGMYTRLDGTHSRVPVGSHKIGRIAQERRPLLTNNVFDESSIDKEWAEREGMVAFAGYPILLDEQLVGVIAMFTRHPIPLSNFEALEFAAREMALGIKRKQAEVALQASETELRTLIEAIPDPLYILSAQGQIICAIAVEPDLRCHPIEEMIGKTLHQLGKEQADEFVGYIQQVLRTQQILTVEYSMFLNGRETWFSTRIAPLPHEQVIWLTRDITALKQAEATSILEERNRMAREIHDTLAQAFTGILIQVGAATQVLTDDPEATQAHLDTIEELARTGLTEARRSVTALRPQLLEDSDLSTALDRLVAQMRATTDTALIYQIQGTAYGLPAEVENNLLRIGQEALT